MSRFRDHRVIGSASDLHRRAIADDRADADDRVPSVVCLDVTAPAVVLGSTQPVDVVLPAVELAAKGIEVARRRSGGGVVWLAPGESHWIDVTIGIDDEYWTDDVGAAFLWLGDRFVAALGSLGIDAVTHRGRLIDRGGSSIVCFAGLGSGEVTVDGRKLIGMSQRRVRGQGPVSAGDV